MKERFPEYKCSGSLVGAHDLEKKGEVRGFSYTLATCKHLVVLAEVFQIPRKGACSATFSDKILFSQPS